MQAHYCFLESTPRLFAYFLIETKGIKFLLLSCLITKLKITFAFHFYRRALFLNQGFRVQLLAELKYIFKVFGELRNDKSDKFWPGFDSTVEVQDGLLYRGFI